MLELATREAVSLSRCTHALFPRYGSKGESCSGRRVGSGEETDPSFEVFDFWGFGYTHVHDNIRVIPRVM